MQWLVQDVLRQGYIVITFRELFMSTHFLKFTRAVKTLAGSALLASAVALPASAAIVVYSKEVGSTVQFTYSGTLDLTGLTGGTPTATSDPFGAVGAHEPYFGHLNGESRIFYDGPYSGVVGSVYDGTGNSYFFNSTDLFGDSFFFRNINFALAADYAGETISGGFTMLAASFSSLNLVADATEVRTLTNGDTITWNVFADPAPVPLPAGALLLLTGLAGLGFAKKRRAAA